MRLEARSVTLVRAGRVIFSDLSFVVESGSALIVSGPNGAGKSSLLRALADLLPAAHGSFVCDRAHDDRRAEMCHYIGHADALKNALTVAENLAFWGALLRQDGTGQDGTVKDSGWPVDAALARFGLAHAANLPAAYLSAGQRRRAALARLLVTARPLWLLDEPLTALDAASQAVLGDVMQAHLAGGGSIVAATHAPLGLAPARHLALGPRA